MNIVNKPARSKWSDLMKRPTLDTSNISKTVQSILDQVRLNGDKALLKLTAQLDHANVSSIQVETDEIMNGVGQVSASLKQAIQLAFDNIKSFHESQKQDTIEVETSPGVRCWRKNVAIEKVGLYIPGGTAPLFSTILMLGIPAKLAACQEIILCTPPNAAGQIDPAILYTAQLVGIDKIYKVGGAQAIAAMAFGTESVPQVYKIFGPGNQYVSKAKQLVQLEGIAIDMVAGPSELLVIVDNTCVPSFVASDLLSQAEHGIDSQVILLSSDETMLHKTIAELQLQLEVLPRKAIAAQSLSNSRFVLLDSMEDCLGFSNAYAPEHLIIASEQAENYEEQVFNAGSVFLGNYSCESAGDYASGTNHTLPTNGFAKSTSGVSLDSFYKKITFQALTAKGIQNIGPSIELMAEAEQLQAHKNAVSIRLKALQND